MKLVIFTPAVKTSAIGRSTSLVTHALKKSGHAVVVVRSENSSLMLAETHDFGVELVPWTESVRITALVRDADTLVYQVGDNYVYHRGCLEWIHRAPGVICLHDFFLGNLFSGWAQDHKPEALATLRAWYGNEISNAFFRYKSSAEFIQATKDSAPMTEWICSMAYGVITHSNWGIQRVLNSCPGPVRVVALPYDAPVSALVPKCAFNFERVNDEFNVLTVGHVNPNKRADSVIRAIGNSSVLRRTTTYQLVGQIHPEVSERLASLANSLHVKLVIAGEVDADTLLRAIAKAHVICCLRWPSLEAASASTIEAMLYGKPVIVTDTGFYSELSDDCVKKIRIENEIADLQESIESLLENETERKALGARAAEWATAIFRAQNYAHQLIETSMALQRASPMLKASQFLTDTLLKWEASPNLITSSDITEPLRLLESCLEAAPTSDIDKHADQLNLRQS